MGTLQPPLGVTTHQERMSLLETVSTDRFWGWSCRVFVIASLIFFICASKKTSATQTRGKAFITKVPGAAGSSWEEWRFPGTRRPVTCIWGRMWKKYGPFSIREHWARAAWGRSSSVEAKGARVSSQLCHCCMALRKSLKCHFSDTPSEAAQSEVASAPATFSPIIHFTPCSALATAGRPAFIYVPTFSVSSVPGPGRECYEVRASAVSWPPSQHSSLQEL